MLIFAETRPLYLPSIIESMYVHIIMQQSKIALENII